MNTTHSSLQRATSSGAPVGRALVLGGGGAAGNAWLIGVIAGLLGAGVDVTHPDLIIGTSAGATAAAQITSATPPELLADILSAVLPERDTPQRGAQPGNAGGHRPPGIGDHLQTTNAIIATASGPADMRRRIGAATLETLAASDASSTQRWRATVAARFASHDWPAKPILITAVDARTGDPVEFDSSSGVDLVDAVAASTSGGPLPYRIGDELYIDGGYRRSSENADLAAGYARVLVLSPLGGRTRFPLEWGMHLAVQVEELKAAGSLVETVLPDPDSLAAFGDDLMDLSTRTPAARAGFAQGEAVAERLAGFWR